MTPPRDRRLFIDAIMGQRSFRYAAAIAILLAVMARWPRLGLPVATAVAVALFLAGLAQARRQARLAQRAVLAARAGDAHAAAEAWEGCARGSWGGHRATALLSAGMLRFRAGELGPARDALAGVERSHGLVPARYGQGVASFLSLVLALQGERDAAGRRGGPRGGPDRGGVARARGELRARRAAPAPPRARLPPPRRRADTGRG